MKVQPASFLVLAGLLAACGGSGNNNNGGGGGGGNPPPASSFTLTYSPANTAFNVPKGQKADLTVTASITGDIIKKVRLTFTTNAAEVYVSDKYPEIVGNGSTTVTVSVPSDITNPCPSFTVTATGLDKDGRPKGETPPLMKFQWPVAQQACPK